MSLRTNRPSSVPNPESWRVLHRNVQTGSLLLQRKTVMRNCFDFVKPGHIFAEKSQKFELPEVRDSRVASVACTRKGERVGINSREDSCFPIRQNWKHARSVIRTHTLTRRPENPNSSSEAISQSTDDPKSGAFDHSAIVAPFDWTFFGNALKQCRLCVESFPFIVHLKSAKHAPLSVLSATHDGEAAGTLLALHQTLGHQDHVRSSPIQLKLIQSSSNFDLLKTSSPLLTENTVWYLEIGLDNLRTLHLGIIPLAIHDNIIHGLLSFVTYAWCRVLGCE